VEDIKMDLKRNMVWIGLTGSGYGPVADFVSAVMNLLVP
jgi:hypothetical protein